MSMRIGGWNRQILDDHFARIFAVETAHAVGIITRMDQARAISFAPAVGHLIGIYIGLRLLFSGMLCIVAAQHPQIGGSPQPRPSASGGKKLPRPAYFSVIHPAEQGHAAEADQASYFRSSVKLRLFSGRHRDGHSPDCGPKYYKDQMEAVTGITCTHKK